MIQNDIMLGVTQYVILECGMDTYDYRNQTNLTIFEGDYPTTKSFMQQRIKELEWTNPSNLHYVSIDLTKDNVAELLIKTGFNPNKRTIFSLLRVTYYLTSENILKLLNQLKSRSIFSHIS